MKILVTGGAGFIGSHTIDALLRSGHDVRILDSLEKPVHLKGKPAYILPEAEFIEGDVRKKGDWEKSLDGVDVVYHLAAYQDYLPDFGKFFHVNSVGTALLFETAIEKRIPLQKVILASSQGVYGEGRYRCPSEACRASSPNKGIYYPSIRPEERLRAGEWDHLCPSCGAVVEPEPTDESVVHPENQYAVSKYTQELIALSLGKRYGIPVVAMRYSIVQGPRQSFHNAYSGACRIFCLNYRFNKQPTVYEDGAQIRDYVNIRDVVEANLLVLGKREADDGVFNVGGGKPYTVCEFAEIVRREFGSEMRPRIPREFRFGDTRHILSDIGRLRALGWEPKFTPEDSVREYVAWLRDQSAVENILDDTNQRMRELKAVRTVNGTQVER